MTENYIEAQIAFWTDDLSFWRRMLEIYQNAAKAEGKPPTDVTVKHIRQAERNISSARRFLAKYYRKDLGAGLSQLVDENLERR